MSGYVCLWPMYMRAKLLSWAWGVGSRKALGLVGALAAQKGPPRPHCVFPASNAASTRVYRQDLDAGHGLHGQRDLWQHPALLWHAEGRGVGFRFWPSSALSTRGLTHWKSRRTKVPGCVAALPRRSWFRLWVEHGKLTESGVEGVAGRGRGGGAHTRSKRGLVRLSRTGRYRRGAACDRAQSARVCCTQHDRRSTSGA